MRVYINSISEMTLAEHTMIAYHSLLNIVNIVAGHLQVLEVDLSQQAEKKDHDPDQEQDHDQDHDAGFKTSDVVKEEIRQRIEQALALSPKIVAGLTEPEIIEYCKAFNESIMVFLEANRDFLSTLLDAERIAFLERNLRSIFGIMEVRLQELHDRMGEQDWHNFNVSDLVVEYEEVLTAVALNSDGRYGIKYTTKEARSATDYLIKLRIRGRPDSPETIHLPKVMTDVFRDLLLNARKYTQIGGEISGRIRDNGRQVTIRIRDNGLGIPEDELKKVANFGYRGTNVINRRTNGGGFGLTKAFLMCRKYSGSMWIESEVGKGTIINLTIPSQHILTHPIPSS